jgi:group I intron endonuclease
MIVYKTTNLINGKFYIGKDSKNNPEYLGSGLNLQRAMKKYGKENFEKIILEHCKSNEQLCEREKHWIKETKAQELGYNIADGGHGGNTYTEETKEKVRQLFKGRYISPEIIEKRKLTRAKNPEKYKLSEERKKAIGDFHRGKTISEEQKYELSERMKNFNNYSAEFLNNQTKDKYSTNNNMFGKKHTEETKKKMSEAHKKNPVRYWLGKKMSSETKEKIRIKSSLHRHTEETKEKIKAKSSQFRHSEDTKEKLRLSRLGKQSWNKGKKMSEETKEKLRKAALGRKLSPRSKEHKRKLSEALKGKKRTPEHQAALTAALKGKKAWNKGLTKVEILERSKKLVNS